MAIQRTVYNTIISFNFMKCKFMVVGSVFIIVFHFANSLLLDNASFIDFPVCFKFFIIVLGVFQAVANLTCIDETTYLMLCRCGCCGFVFVLS